MNKPDFAELVTMMREHVDPFYFILGTMSIAKRWSLTKSFRAWMMTKGIITTLADVNRLPLPRGLDRGNKYIKAMSDDDEIKESDCSPDTDYRILMDYPYTAFSGYLLKGYDIGEAAKASANMAAKPVPIEEINEILAINNNELVDAFGNLWTTRVDEQEMK